MQRHGKPPALWMGTAGCSHVGTVWQFLKMKDKFTTSWAIPLIGSHLRDVKTFTETAWEQWQQHCDSQQGETTMVTTVSTIKMSLPLTGRPGPMCKPSVTTTSGTQSHAWEGREQGARTVSALSIRTLDSQWGKRKDWGREDSIPCVLETTRGKVSRRVSLWRHEDARIIISDSSSQAFRAQDSENYWGLLSVWVTSADSVWGIITSFKQEYMRTVFHCLVNIPSLWLVFFLIFEMRNFPISVKCYYQLFNGSYTGCHILQRYLTWGHEHFLLRLHLGDDPLPLVNLHSL